VATSGDTGSAGKTQNSIVLKLKRKFTINQLCYFIVNILFLIFLTQKLNNENKKNKGKQGWVGLTSGIHFFVSF